MSVEIDGAMCLLAKGDWAIPEDFRKVKNVNCRFEIQNLTNMKILLPALTVPSWRS